jgi:hypothetical protein
MAVRFAAGEGKAKKRIFKTFVARVTMRVPFFYFVKFVFHLSGVRLKKLLAVTRLMPGI